MEKEEWVCPRCKIGVMRRSEERERELDTLARKIEWLVSQKSSRRQEPSSPVPSKPSKIFICDKCHYEELKTDPPAELEMWKKLAKYKCNVYGHVYDPEKGERGILMMYEMKDGRIWERWERQVMPGTPFEKVPDSWVCPRCEATRDHFEKIDKSVSA